MKNEVICAAMAQPKQNKAQKMLGNVLGFGTALSAVASTATTTVFASEWANNGIDVTGVDGSGDEGSTMMSNVIGILLTISKYVGVALIIYGIYEVVMSFTQNQPEAKTKGIVMALSGAVMVGLKSIITDVLGVG